MRNLIILGSQQWILLAGGLVLVVLSFGFFAIPVWFREYQVEHRGPKLQQCLGFSASPAPASGQASTGEVVLAITSVRPNSPLLRAGVQPGDIIVGYKHGMDVGFYSDLDAAVRGEDVEFSVLASHERGGGYQRWRRIRLSGLHLDCQ